MHNNTHYIIINLFLLHYYKWLQASPPLKKSVVGWFEIILLQSYYATTP